ncbi:hypothetical protein [Plasmodium yoelii yoelii]|uniref:Uncharacterized protein n=3 Tax=Plasmodium yoelii TaxID=5861 RepID=Q7RJH1_PLAYO|nr:hypothetical protein [Plasmodium yoelii yoelii]
MKKMSAMSIKVDNRYIIKEKENTNNQCDQINVDINHIIKDIYGFNCNKKRSAHFISDNTINNSQDIKNLYKKIKIQDYNNIIKTTESHDNKSEYDHDTSTIFDNNENKNCINVGSGNEDNNYGYPNLKSNRKSTKNSRDNNNNINDDVEKKKRICNNYTDNNVNEEIENNLSKKFETLIDNVLEKISTCNEINQAKKIMIPMISNFIQNNFESNNNSKEDNKIENEILQKEKKVLINAVKTQYHKIINLQKVIDNQKIELKKKNDELNKIKAKVHEYFYDLNNSNKRVFNILTPDVY